MTANSLPHASFPKFVTLNGADTFFIMLDRNNEKFKQGNSLLRMCITCASEEDSLMVEDRIVNSAIVHWMCNVRLVSDKRILFKPKWRYENTGKKLAINSIHLEMDEDPILAIVNRPLSLKNNEWMSCDRLVSASGEVTLVLSWHHALMDGRGSGHLIRNLFNDKSSEHYFFPVEEKEPSIYSYIKNMYRVKRFIQHSSRFPIGAIRKWKNESQTQQIFTKFFSHTFSEDETISIDANASAAGSRFGSNNFLLACCAVAVDKLRFEQGVQGDLWIPVPYDGRKRGGSGPVISNQISFLFYRLTPDDLNSVVDCVRSIQTQMMEQMKIEMPRKYNQLLDLMRYIPLSLYKYLTTKSSEGRVASFLFSSAGQDKWDLANLANNQIRSIQLIPPATVPPGLTFNFLRNENRLTLNMLCSTAVLDESEMIELNNVLVGLLKS